MIRAISLAYLFLKVNWAETGNSGSGRKGKESSQDSKATPPPPRPTASVDLPPDSEVFADASSVCIAFHSGSARRLRPLAPEKSTDKHNFAVSAATWRARYLS